MSEQDEVELRHALAEGLLSREECDALREEAARLGRRPLELLKERGRLSEDTHASLLRLMLREEDTRGPVAPVTVDTGRQAPGKDATLSLEMGLAQVSPPPPVEVPAFPVSDWEHYSPIRFLGQGGMGRVFLARDNRLHRQVALKFVRGDEPELVRRFVLEARAQARVAHPRVCEVYEVGEVQGRAYIAMRHVEGQPLHALVETLSVEQKARVLREAAEGVHAAHRAGLIHRDIKPSNILVERSAEGALSPFVMDFGLARDWKEGVTATGTVLGTPHYMSPEQARGEVARLDRRADVYSLGATLYALLTGTPPIPGQNGLEVLGNIGTVEPRPPRALDRDIPVDLEAITLKCLEKERSARYGSARELAEDLGRFLDGEPVLARTGPGYRARKWLRKHRRAVAVGTGALVVVSLAVGQSVLARREVSQREALARRFTEQVERIEAQARYSGTSPLHDTRRDREALGARMRELGTAMRDAGPMGQTSGHYALGRGYLALDDDARARMHLEAAWEAGATEPRVAYSLALALAHLYQQARLEAERQQPAATRRDRLRKAVQRYGEPARDFLRKSEGAEVPAPEYVAALLAFLEDRPEEALAKLDALGSRLPWFHEAPLLRGDILLARGASRWNTGNREGALADFDAGRRAYARAADIGRSVSAVYRALADLEGWVLQVALYGQGDVPSQYARGVEATSKALVLAPDDAKAHEQEAGFHRRLAEHLARQGGDVEPLLEKALGAARRSVELRPDRARGQHELAMVHWQRARLRQEKGLDALDSLREAAAAFERIPEEARDYDVHADMGQVFRVWADQEEGRGRDSLPYRAKAIGAHVSAMSMDRSKPAAWINLGIEYLALSSNPRAEDPSGDLDRAAAALESAQAINPDHVVPWFYAGEVHLARAARHRDAGADPRPALTSALTAYEKGVAINPKLPPLHNGLGTVWFERAKDEWERGADPSPSLREALKAFDAAIALAPAQGFGQNNVGEVHAWRASLRVLEGQSPAGEVRAARVALKDALARIPDLPQPWMNLGAALQAEAAWTVKQGRAPGPVLEESLKSLRRALELNPKQAQAWRVLGEALAVQALAKARAGQAPDQDFTEADQALSRAVALEPSQPEHLVAQARVCLAWGQWLGMPGGQPVVARGGALADKALSLRARWPRAQALRAGLMLALTPPDAQGAPAPRREAREVLARALADNPHLLREWERWLPAASGAAEVTR
ncbi:serine/threonine-protein kinase [Myxococcus landrumensis]|uniref:non-specific serine/threonine protein kinase n=1 Tax=Myxococcus landrumensis TaxID=2813577 RepID=A0ABX7N0N9_9BACT|nr:serine/threonine-protein kinase [Myxococcus landrumus]QSQ11994.1 protein kinase [Myxococcus landrumus]